MLRSHFRDRWVRFHSLPESKRYPEDEAEYRILLDRHNVVVGELAQPRQNLLLLTTTFSETSAPTTAPAECPSASFWRTVSMHEVEPEVFDFPAFWHVYVSQVGWWPGVFDPVIRLAADDVLADVLICDADCRWIVHPYDGGMDVIASSTPARDRLRAKFGAWLSARPDGL